MKKNIETMTQFNDELRKWKEGVSTKKAAIYSLLTPSGKFATLAKFQSGVKRGYLTEQCIPKSNFSTRPWNCEYIFTRTSKKMPKRKKGGKRGGFKIGPSRATKMSVQTHIEELRKDSFWALGTSLTKLGGHNPLIDLQKLMTQSTVITYLRYWLYRDVVGEKQNSYIPEKLVLLLHLKNAQELIELFLHLRRIEDDPKGLPQWRYDASVKEEFKNFFRGLD